MHQQIQPDPEPAVPEPAGPESAPARTVTLGISAERDQVVLARSVVGHVAARLGLSVAELTDLRLAVDESCGLFLLSPDFAAAGKSLECRFAEWPQALVITVSAPVSASFAPDTDDIGWIMLGALVDELDWTVAEGIGRVTLTKKLAVREG